MNFESNLFTHAVDEAEAKKKPEFIEFTWWRVQVLDVQSHEISKRVCIHTFKDNQKVDQIQRSEEKRNVESVKKRRNKNKNCIRRIENSWKHFFVKKMNRTKMQWESWRALIGTFSLRFFVCVYLFSLFFFFGLFLWRSCCNGMVTTNAILISIQCNLKRRTHKTEKKQRKTMKKREKRKRKWKRSQCYSRLYEKKNKTNSQTKLKRNKKDFLFWKKRVKKKHRKSNRK